MLVAMVKPTVKSTATATQITSMATRILYVIVDPSKTLSVLFFDAPPPPPPASPKVTSVPSEDLSFDKPGWRSQPTEKERRGSGGEQKKN